MQSKYLQRLTDEDFPAILGVNRQLFEEIYHKYCKDTSINKPYALVLVVRLDSCIVQVEIGSCVISAENQPNVSTFPGGNARQGQACHFQDSLAACAGSC